jgi:rhomboid family protein
MSYALSDDSDYPRITPAVKWLIAINVAIFFLQVTIVRADDMQQWLGFQSGDLGRSWWTIVTYMFVHAGLLHLALNMYTLFMFGPRVEHAWNTREFTRYYILCGLGGWLAHLMFVKNGLLVGASAAVMGVMLAYAVRWPDDEVYLFGLVPIKVKWLVAIFALSNLVSGIGMGTAGSGVAYLAHLGGMATGALILWTSSATGIDKLRQRVTQIPDVPDETPRAIPRSLPRSREKAHDVDDIVARSKAALARRQPSAPQATARPVKHAEPLTRTEELNLLLDKISEYGIESLTSEERKMLDDVSKSLRQE